MNDKFKQTNIFLSPLQISKTLKATLTALLDSMCDSDSNPSPDVPSSLSHEPPGGSSAPKLTLAKRRANQQETETYYFTVSQCIEGETGFASFRYLLYIKIDDWPISAVRF